MKKDDYKFIKVYILIVLAVFMMIALFSCKTQYVPVETVRTEYKVRVDTFLQKDSVHVKDSVFIHSIGDTVWYEKWHTKYIDRWKEVIKCDTLVKTDSIQVPYPVPQKPTIGDKLKWFGGGVILALIGMFAVITAIMRKR